MQATADDLFKTLGDPTRRAIFERLAHDGEQTVHALTDNAGVSQPMVSKHLGVLKLAGLVRDRREGREDPLQCPAASAGALDRLDESLWRLLARTVRSPRNSVEKDGPMSEPAATRTLVIEREMPHPPEKVWRVLTQGPLIEEHETWLRTRLKRSR